jgi:hypothetical protein
VLRHRLVPAIPSSSTMVVTEFAQTPSDDRCGLTRLDIVAYLHSGSLTPGVYSPTNAKFAHDAVEYVAECNLGRPTGLSGARCGRLAPAQGHAHYDSTL